MAKKILCVITLMLALVCVLASCGGDKHTHSFGEWTVTKEATAIEKGLEERYCDCGEKEVRELDCVSCDVSGIHTYVKGACVGCGTKIFDVLKAYIIANVDTITGDNRYLCYYGDYNNDTNFTICEYDTSRNRITILARYKYLLHTFSTDIYITPYSLEDGGYEWEGSCIKWPSDDCIDLSGYLDPSKFSSSTTRLPHSSSGSKADDMAKKYADALHINIREEINAFLNDVGYNISLSDLGFTRYN